MTDWLSEIRARLAAATVFHHIGHVSEINPEAVDLMSENGEFIGEIRGRNNEAFYSHAQLDMANLLEAIRMKDEALKKLKNTDTFSPFSKYIDLALAFDPTKKAQEDGK